MKITKKQPLRPRGRSDEKRQSTKDAIREVYANGPQKEVQIIPAKKDMVTDAEKKKLRVCAYCRVSTEEDNQASSYELQVQNYTKMIHENPEWEFAGIFADEGISGTSVLHREHFLEMIEKCKAGEIDLIITKQVSRFARNVLDSLNYIFMLRKLDPPVGVYFETEKLNTLDRSSDMVITVLSLVAQSESEQKSNSLKWSFKRRRAQGMGIYPNWCLLGYKGHDWEIDEDEADVVRTIYSLYLEGYVFINSSFCFPKNEYAFRSIWDRATFCCPVSYLSNLSFCFTLCEIDHCFLLLFGLLCEQCCAAPGVGDIGHNIVRLLNHPLITP